MADEALVDRLDQTIDLLLARRDATAALSDPELAPLAVLAAELRHVPSAAFRERLLATSDPENDDDDTGTRADEDSRGFHDGDAVCPRARSRTPRLPDRGLRREGDVQRAGGAGGVHREVRVGDSMLMIGEGGVEGGLPFSPAAFHVYVPDADAAFQRALAAGGTSMGDPEDRPYGERAGFIKDAFGNHWYIATAFGASLCAGRAADDHAVRASAWRAGVHRLPEARVRRRGGVPPRGRGVVMHARLLIGNGAIEMGDTQGTSEPMRTGFYLYVRRRGCAVRAGGGRRRDAARRRRPISPMATAWAASMDDQGITWFIAQPA